MSVGQERSLDPHIDVPLRQFPAQVLCERMMYACPRAPKVFLEGAQHLRFSHADLNGDLIGCQKGHAEAMAAACISDRTENL